MGKAFPAADHVDPDDQISVSVLHLAAKLSDDEVLTLADALHDLLRRRRVQRHSKEAYAVLRSGPEWQIVCQRRRMGHFDTLASAIEAGARLVRQAELSGRRIELLVQEDAGQLVPLDRLAVRTEETGCDRGAVQVDGEPYLTMEDVHRLLAEANHPFQTSAAVHALKEAIRCDRFTDEDVRAFALKAIEPWL